jgi:hypothetical protein
METNLAGMTVVQLAAGPGPWHGGVTASDVVTCVFLARDSYTERMARLKALLGSDYQQVRSVLEEARAAYDNFDFVREQIGLDTPLEGLLGDDSPLHLTPPKRRRRMDIFDAVLEAVRDALDDFP